MDLDDFEPQVGGRGMSFEEILEWLRKDHPEQYNELLKDFQAEADKIQPEYRWVLDLKPL